MKKEQKNFKNCYFFYILYIISFWMKAFMIAVPSSAKKMNYYQLLRFYVIFAYIRSMYYLSLERYIYCFNIKYVYNRDILELWHSLMQTLSI